jgi:hypothetical protein
MSSMPINRFSIAFCIFLQERDIKNTINLVTYIRNTFPNNIIVVFFSGEHTAGFDLLNRICTKNSTLLMHSIKPKTIGFAVNKLIDKTVVAWVVLLDGDVTPTRSMFDLLAMGVNNIAPDIKVIQGYILPQLHANIWAKLDCMNDTLAYLADRTKPTAWFSDNHLEIPSRKILSTLHGGVMIVNRYAFLKSGGMEEDALLVQRAYAAKITKAGFKILFIKQLSARHIYSKSLRGVLRRKVFHAKGSAINRIRHPELYADSLKIRVSMLKSAVVPPPAFHTIYGRIYFFTTMVVFTIALSYYKYKLSRDFKSNTFSYAKYFKYSQKQR